MNEKNYYDEIIEQIKEIEKSDKQQAILILKKELSMPYIPEQYENEMISLLKKFEQTNDQKNLTASREEIIESLFSDKNDGKKLFLINKISEFSWVGFENEIQKVFSSAKIKNNFKTIFLENLIEQKIDYDFKIENKIINPKKIKSIFASDFCNKNIAILESPDFSKDQIVKRISIETLLIYISSLFPHNIDLKFEDISKEILEVSNILLGKNDGQNISLLSKKILDLITNN
ncbi:MAG: hypothetical protein ACRCRZ_02305 [Metamycoplasmataceae bacterium]